MTPPTDRERPALSEGDLAAMVFPPDARFTFMDDPGEHDPCYVVMPGGAALPLNHHVGEGVDVARAKFIIDACNAALDRLATPNMGRVAQAVRRVLAAQMTGSIVERLTADITDAVMALGGGSVAEDLAAPTKATPTDRERPALSEGDWRPIESAPKDRFVLLYTPPEGEMCGFVAMAKWQGSSWYGVDDEGLVFNPLQAWDHTTHWRPLPAPPGWDVDDGAATRHSGQLRDEHISPPSPDAEALAKIVMDMHAEYMRDEECDYVIINYLIEEAAALIRGSGR